MLFFIGSNKVLADDDLGFYVSPVIPSTQIDFSRSFFYVQTVPEEKQTLKVHVVNTDDKEKTIKVDVLDARSTELGSIDYGEAKVKDASLVNPISEIVTIKDKEIKLKADESKVVEFEVNPPEKHYEGVKMGMLVFTFDTGETVEEIVAVEKAYQIGIVTSESNEDFRNGSELQIADVVPGLNRGRKAVDVHLQNPQSKIIQNLSIDSVIINTDTNEEVMKRQVENYSLAPNSILPFIFDWGLSNILPGKYKVVMNIANGEHEFNLEKNFEITDAQAKKINDESPFRINTPQWIKILSIVLGILTVVITVLTFVRQGKWNKQLKHRKRKNSRRKSKRKGQ